MITEGHDKVMKLAAWIAAAADQGRPNGAAPKLETTEDEVRDALGHLNKDHYLGARGEASWLTVGMALHAGEQSGELPEGRGLALWIEWSQGFRTDCTHATFHAKWHSFKDKGEGGVGLGSIFYWAAASGWKRPKRRRKGRRTEAEEPMARARDFVAERQTDEAGQRLLHWRKGDFLVHHGSCYRRQKANQDLRPKVWRYCDDRGHQPTIGTVANVLQALEAVCHLESYTAIPAWLDQGAAWAPAHELLSVKNGLLHLPTREVRPHTPALLNLLALPYDHDPAATCPEWDAFLRQLWPDDQQSIDTLHEWFGYCLTPDTSLQTILVLYTPSRGGKGTISRVLTALLGGKEQVAATSLQKLGTRFGKEGLIDKTLAVIGQVQLSRRTDVDAMLETLLAISGEDDVEVERKHLAAYTDRLPVRFMLLMTEVPQIPDPTGQLMNRLLLLGHELTFKGKEDRGLTGKLLKELPGILNHAVAGYHRLYARGHFEQPESGEVKLAEVRAQLNPFEGFLNAYFVRERGATVAKEVAQKLWESKHADYGEGFKGTADELGRLLKANWPEVDVRKARTKDGREQQYVGLRVRTRADDELAERALRDIMEAQTAAPF